MQKLTPEQELAFLRQIHGERPECIFKFLNECFAVIQTRSQMLLGLITICLTITGFSGQKIADAGPLSKAGVVVGVISVLVSALIILSGPLHLRWMTQSKFASLDETLVELIRRRNSKTLHYHWAMLCLVLGLTGYVASFAAALMR